MSLEFDIRRTIILSEYMKNWGMPEFRRIMSKDNESVELYEFPCAGSDIYRFATVGLSSFNFSDSKTCNVELVLVVSNSIALKQNQDLYNYLFDVMAYILAEMGGYAKPEDLIPESALAPDGWPKALLFDEPRGEPESLGCFHVGSQHVDLLWLIPIFGSEYDLIKEEGIRRFDAAIEDMKLELVDVNRQSCG